MFSWLLTAALAQDSARARLDEGWRRVELGDLVGARLIADEAAQLDPALQAGPAAERDGPAPYLRQSRQPRRPAGSHA